MSPDSRPIPAHPAEHALRMRAVPVGDTEVITLVGDLDHATAPRLAHQLSSLTRPAGTTIAIDLRGLTSIDAHGVHLIADAHERWVRGECRVVIVRGTPAVQREFESSGLGHRLPFADTLPRAVVDARVREARRARHAAPRCVYDATIAAAVRELRTARRAGAIRYS